MAAEAGIVARFWREFDARKVAQYPFSDAARYLLMPESTLRAWFVGTTYGRAPNTKRFRPFLVPESKDLLSFYDIASVHVLLAFRRNGATSEDIRSIVDSLRKEYPKERYPLLGRDFHAFKRHVVLKQPDGLLNLTKSRQYGLRTVMEAFLSRIDMDASYMPLRFSPMTESVTKRRGAIVLDPHVSSGRPTIRETGIMAETVFKRFKAGESPRSVARDLHLKPSQVAEAIKYCEQTSKRAA